MKVGGRGGVGLERVRERGGGRMGLSIWGGGGRFMLRKEEGCVWLGEIRMVYDNL